MLTQQRDKLDRLRHLRERYRELANTRAEEIFDLKEELSAKVMKEESKSVKYANSDEETY